MKRLSILFLLCALPVFAQGPAITQQPVSQTVQAGNPASFTVTVSGGPCRSLWLINGAGHYGSFASTITYTFPSTTLAQSGTSVQVQLYGCAAGAISLLSNKVTLTVINVVTLQSIALTPITPIIGIGQTQAFTATGQFNNGSTQDLSATATWASSSTAISLSQNVATGASMGSAIITATSGGISGSTVLVVQPLITVNFSALYDDGTVPQLQLIVNQVTLNADGTTTAVGLLALTPDATGNAAGSFLVDPAMTYQAAVVLNGVPISPNAFYPAALMLATMPNITKANFGLVLFRSTGLVKGFTSGAQ